jgi:hypothetical protein
MIALIDADILVYRVGYTTNELSAGIAAARLGESIEGILLALDTRELELYLTSQEKNNYRYTIDPEYKAGRLTSKPTHYHFLREHLVLAHKASVVENQEADDMLGIRSTQLAPEGVICSIDKDLDQIPGWHYNFVKDVKYEVTPLEGLRFFYYQLLTGDRIDNIMGVPGIGPVKATKILQGKTTEEDMFNAVRDTYRLAFPDSWETQLRKFGQLLKIRTIEGELWDFPDARKPSTVQA